MLAVRRSPIRCWLVLEVLRWLAHRRPRRIRRRQRASPQCFRVCLWLFADGMTAPEAVRGELRVWGTPWHEEVVVPMLRKMLELPFERVLVSHGRPVHDRAALEKALTAPMWVGWANACLY